MEFYFKQVLINTLRLYIQVQGCEGAGKGMYTIQFSEPVAFSIYTY